jgi:hypothetical protein
VEPAPSVRAGNGAGVEVEAVGVVGGADHHIVADTAVAVEVVVAGVAAHGVAGGETVGHVVPGSAGDIDSLAAVVGAEEFQPATAGRGDLLNSVKVPDIDLHHGSGVGRVLEVDVVGVAPVHRDLRRRRRGNVGLGAVEGIGVPSSADCPHSHRQLNLHSAPSRRSPHRHLECCSHDCSWGGLAQRDGPCSQKLLTDTT